MVKPKCPKCEGEKFGALEQPINGYIYNGIFVCCVDCNTTVGVLDYGNYLKPLGKISEDITALKEEIAQLKEALNN